MDIDTPGGQGNRAGGNQSDDYPRQGIQMTDIAASYLLTKQLQKGRVKTGGAGHWLIRLVVQKDYLMSRLPPTLILMLELVLCKVMLRDSTFLTKKDRQ